MAICGPWLLAGDPCLELVIGGVGRWRGLVVLWYGPVMGAGWWVGEIVVRRVLGIAVYLGAIVLSDYANIVDLSEER